MIRCYANGLLTISAMGVRLLFIFVVIFERAFAQRGNSCITPNLEEATCVPISTCKVLLDAINSRNSSAREFTLRSQCGFDSEPLVCCGSSGHKTLSFDFFDLFTKAPETRNKVARKEVEARILSNFNTNALPDRTVCGLQNIKDRIIVGQKTDIGEFPWMVALEYKFKQNNTNAGIRCGGTLINNRYVLSAAHCIINKKFKLIKVWLGEWQISVDPDCEKEAKSKCADRVQKIKIKKAIPHPFYSTKSGTNDIGLLRLKDDIKYSNYTRPICLPPSDLPYPEIGTSLTLAGWGTTENGTSSDVKLTVQVPLLSIKNCKSKLEGGIVRANQLCAGAEQEKGSCHGDSGGPLMTVFEDSLNDNVEQWYQEGVVEFGAGCGRLGRPAVYTRVSRYTSWIKNYIMED